MEKDPPQTSALVPAFQVPPTAWPIERVLEATNGRVFLALRRAGGYHSGREGLVSQYRFRKR